MAHEATIACTDVDMNKLVSGGDVVERARVHERGVSASDDFHILLLFCCVGWGTKTKQAGGARARTQMPQAQQLRQAPSRSSGVGLIRYGRKVKQTHSTRGVVEGGLL